MSRESLMTVIMAQYMVPTVAAVRRARPPSQPERPTVTLTKLKLAAALVASVALTGLGTAGAQAGAQTAPTWQLVDTGSTSHFRGLAPVSAKVAWVSGYDGLVLRTVDGGRSWADVSPAGAQTLQFRDISAFDARHAVAMAAGEGTDSRLYATDDGGHTWNLSYQNTDDAAFFDCMSFSDPRHGLVMSDPVDGKFRILSTQDGGRRWQVLPTTGMPAALEGEYGFAAGGECLTTVGRQAWFGTGGTSGARIFHSGDGGLTWTADDSSLAYGESAGVFAIAFQNSPSYKPGPGIAVGGDFAAPNASVNVSATKGPRGPWRPARVEPTGYRSGVTFVPRTRATAVSVGLSGSDVSYDAGRTWKTFDTGQFDTVGCARDGACWASGDLGRVAILGR